MSNSSEYLDLSFLVEYSSFSKEDVEDFSIFFNIPPQNHNLYGHIEQLLLIGRALQKSPKIDINNYLIILEHLQLKKTEVVYKSKLLTQIKGVKTGLASTYPIYNALLNAPSKQGFLNVFEILTGLLFAVNSLKPNISPNPSSQSNIISIARELRKQSKNSHPAYQRIKSELFHLENELDLSQTLNKYLEIMEEDSSYLLPVEMKSLLDYFLDVEKPRENDELDRKRNKEMGGGLSKKKVAKKRPKALTGEEFWKLLDSVDDPIKPARPKQPIEFKPKNNREKVNRLGVVAEDDDNELPVIVNEQIDSEEISLAGNAAAAKASQKKGVMNCQFSRYRWNRYSPLELRLILKAIVEDSESLGAIATLLSLSLGAEPLVWGTYSLRENCTKPYVDLEKKRWGHPIEVHETAWTPTNEQEHLLKDVGSFCHLTLDSTLTERIRSLTCNTSANNLAELFNSTPIQLNELLTSFLLSIDGRNREFTVAKIREELYSTIMDQTMDEVSAQMICGQPTYLLPVQSFYTAIAITDLQKTYENALSTILRFSKFENHYDDRVIGSKLQPLDDVIRSLSNGLQKKIRSDVNDVINYHNTFTLYTHQLLSLASGHRCVDDPYAKMHDFIEILQGVVIYDKFTDTNHSGRMSVLGSIAWTQFENYKTHLEQLSHLINDTHNALSSRINLLLKGRKTLPFLFFLEEKDSKVNVIHLSEREIHSRLTDWSLPLNFNRHLLASKLRALNAPAEMIDYQLGHFQNGVQPLGAGSMFSLKTLSEKLSPLIDNLLQFYGFMPIKSSIHSDKKAKKFTRYGDVKLAFQSRINSFNEKRSKAKIALKKVINEVELGLLELDKESTLYKDDAQTLIKNKLQQLLNHPDSISSSESLIGYGKKIRSLIKTHKLKIKNPIQFNKFPRENSPINFKSGEDYFLTEKYRSELAKKLPLLVEHNKDEAKRLAILLLIEVVFGYLHCTAWVKHFVQSFTSGLFSEDGKTYIDLRYDNKNDAVFRYQLSKMAQLYLQSQNLNITFEDQELFEKSLDEVLADFLTLSEFKSLDIKQFLKVVSTAGVFELPGTLRAITSGEIRSYSMNSSRFVSIIKEKPLKDLSSKSDKNERLLNEVTARSECKHPNYRVTKAMIKEIRTLFSGYDETKQNASQKQRLQNRLNDAIASSDEIFPVYFYILQWGNFLLAEKKPNEDIKAVTINKKIHLNALGLAEVFKDSDLAVLDEVDFIAAYNRVLEYYPSYQDGTIQVINHLRSLLDFHDFMIESFGVPEIDPSDLDLPDELSNYMVSANYLSEFEYFKVFNELKNDQFVSELQRAYQSTVFCLGFNFGARSAEIFSLMLKDIQFTYGDDEILGSISIQPNRLGTLKTDASKRNIPLNIWLTQEEVKLIKQFYDIRVSQGAKLNDPLFSGLSEDYLRDIRIIKSRIIQLMRHFTGDWSLKFHSLRHSFANLMVKGMVENDSLENSGLIKSAKIQNYFDFSQSRRGLFQVARLCGHGHPTTTIINYVHCFDELLFKYSSTNFKEYRFSYDWFASFLPVTASNLRKMKSRQKVPLLDVVGKFITVPDNLSESVLSSEEKSLPALELFTRPKIGFKEISWLISRYFLVKDVERLALLLEVDLDEIAKITDAIVAISNVSGFLPDPLVDLIIPEAYQADIKTNKKPRQDIDESWVKKFENLVVNKDGKKLLPAIKLWIDYVHPDSAGWKFEKWDQYEAFQAFLINTGIDKNRIKLRGHRSSSIPREVKIDQYSRTYKSRQTRKHYHLDFEKLNLELVVTNKRKTSIVHTLNFFLFVAAVLVFKNQYHQIQEWPS